MQFSPDLDYLTINRHQWNERVPVHTKSAFYDVAGFLAGNTSLQTIELDLLGDLRGASVLHLQCHFGQDSISLSRMGAQVTGIDLSDSAIEQARTLAQTAGTTTRFVCSDVYGLPKVLHERFDVVFTSYGVLGWLPDMARWAEVVNHFLAPGGRLILVEFHPVVWMFDDNFQSIAYRYSKGDPIVETVNNTYADGEAIPTVNSISWNHGLAEVMGSLLQQGLIIDHFQEYDYSPYPCFPNCIAVGTRQYRIPHFGDKIPMVYSVVAKKR